jgi:hypothetical protein
VQRCQQHLFVEEKLCLAVIFTMRPHRCSRMCGIAALQSLRIAVGFTPVISSQSSSLELIRPPACARPALWTRISNEENAAIAASTIVGAPGTDTSTATDSTFAPERLRRSASAS